MTDQDEAIQFFQEKRFKLTRTSSCGEAVGSFGLDRPRCAACNVSKVFAALSSLRARRNRIFSQLEYKLRNSIARSLSWNVPRISSPFEYRTFNSYFTNSEEDVDWSWLEI